MTVVVPDTGEIVSEDEYLEQLASRVREESRNLKLSLTDSVEAMFVIGQCLNEARQALPSNEAYGAWFAAQAFDFSTEWGRTLRSGALNEALVRPAIASQLAKGNTSVNFEQTVKKVVGTGKPRPAAKPSVDYKALAAFLVQVLRDLEQFEVLDEDARIAIGDALDHYDAAVQ